MQDKIREAWEDSYWDWVKTQCDECHNKDCDRDIPYCWVTADTYEPFEEGYKSATAEYEKMMEAMKLCENCYDYMIESKECLHNRDGYCDNWKSANNE